MNRQDAKSAKKEKERGGGMGKLISGKLTGSGYKRRATTAFVGCRAWQSSANSMIRFSLTDVDLTGNNVRLVILS
jgi:hypothetical protein